MNYTPTQDFPFSFSSVNRKKVAQTPITNVVLSLFSGEKLVESLENSMNVRFAQEDEFSRQVTEGLTTADNEREEINSFC